MDRTTSRRELLKAAPIAVAVAAIPCVAVAQDTAAEPASTEDHYTREEYEAAQKSAEQVAYLWVARAWLDRWKALGGNVGLTYDNDLNPIGTHRGMLLDLDYWTPTDRGREDLPPHTWLIEDRHHDGAVKALEGLLELAPGLRAAVREIAGREAFQQYAERQEA